MALITRLDSRVLYKWLIRQEWHITSRGSCCEYGTEEFETAIVPWHDHELVSGVHLQAVKAHPRRVLWQDLQRLPTTLRCCRRSSLPLRPMPSDNETSITHEHTHTCIYLFVCLSVCLSVFVCNPYVCLCACVSICVCVCVLRCVCSFIT